MLQSNLAAETNILVSMETGGGFGGEKWLPPMMRLGYSKQQSGSGGCLTKWRPKNHRNTRSLWKSSCRKGRSTSLPQAMLSHCIPVVFRNAHAPTTDINDYCWSPVCEIMLPFFAWLIIIP